MAGESRTAVFAALAWNAALAGLKGLAAAFTGSAAMLAETFHSIEDAGNQVSARCTSGRKGSWSRRTCTSETG